MNLKPTQASVDRKAEIEKLNKEIGKLEKEIEGIHLPDESDDEADLTPYKEMHGKQNELNVKTTKLKKLLEEQEKDDKEEKLLYYTPTAEDTQLKDIRYNYNTYLQEALPIKKQPKLDPLDKRDEKLSDEQNTWWNAADEGLKNLKNVVQTSHTNNKKYDKKIWNFNSKHLSFMSLLYHNNYNNDYLEKTKSRYEDMKTRCITITDFIQTYTNIPMRTRKLTRSNIKPARHYFPIPIENTAATADGNYTSHNFKVDTVNRIDANITKKDLEFYSFPRATRVLRRLINIIKLAPSVTETLLKTKSTKKGVEVDIPKQSIELVLQDVINAVRFIIEACDHAGKFFQKDAQNEIYMCSYPGLRHGTYHGDYKDLFGYAIYSWIHRILKGSKKQDGNAKVFTSIDDITNSHWIEDLLVKRKSYKNYEDKEINAKVEAYKDKLTKIKDAKDIYGHQTYIKEVKEPPPKREMSTQQKISQIQTVDYEQSLESELAELRQMGGDYKKNNIEGHVFLYPSLGRKIMLLTDINHFKYHISDSILSGLGIMLELDILPSNIFKDLRLCSIISGGIFDLKLKSSNHTLDFVYDKRKPLLVNLSDSEFSKYACLFDIHPFYNSQNDLRKFVIPQKITIATYDYNNPSIIPDNLKYRDIHQIGDLSTTVRKAYDKYNITKRAHLLALSSDLHTFNKVETPAMDSYTVNKVTYYAYDYIYYINCIKEFLDKQEFDKYVTNPIVDMTDLNPYNGIKLTFKEMKKIPNIPESLIKDSITFDILKRSWVYINNLNVFDFKKDLRSFYPKSHLDSLSDKELVIRYYPMERLDIANRIGTIQTCADIPTTEELNRQISNKMFESVYDTSNFNTHINQQNLLTREQFASLLDPNDRAVYSQYDPSYQLAMAQQYFTKGNYNNNIQQQIPQHQIPQQSMIQQQMTQQQIPQQRIQPMGVSNAMSFLKSIVQATGIQINSVDKVNELLNYIQNIRINDYQAALNGTLELIKNGVNMEQAILTAYSVYGANN